MKITAVKTEKLLPASQTIFDFLGKHITQLDEDTIVAITSKAVSICEGRIVPTNKATKEELAKQEADYYLPRSFSPHEYAFTITKKTLISSSGIDESNVADHYVLWPKDPQRSANQIRKFLAKTFGLERVGVIITDSCVYPMRYGTLVIPIAHSGFLAINDYRGTPDLFGRPFRVSISSVAGGLAAAAGVVMGEGTEQTPIALISDVPFVKLQARNPTPEELDQLYIKDMGDDLFAPFLKNAPWKKGAQKKRPRPEI